MTKVSKINVQYADEQIKSYADNVRLSATENIRKYLFKSRQRNPDWSVEKLISLRSCHIHNNASRNEPEFFISEIPKWLTVLEKPIAVDTGSGEIIYEDYQTDDFKASRNRKIKTVVKFCDFYEPLYRKRKVSLLFHTFTRIDYAKQDMRTMVECAKSRYESLGWPIRGFLWALELKANENLDGGYHIHYHLVVAVDRVRITEIPEALKFEDLWGQRTGVEFITKSIRRYLSKYLYKSDAKLLGKRSYSISRKLL
jgi:hypothetical protein